jgi:hypothetical protein
MAKRGEENVLKRRREIVHPKNNIIVPHRVEVNSSYYVYV